MTVGYRKPAPPIDLDYCARSFWSKVDVRGPDECWPWLQSLGGHGYGQTWDGITVRLAHRVAWELTNGRLAEGVTIDHTCRWYPCQNPGHMIEATNVDNACDNGNARKTECPEGHAYDEQNTRIDGNGHRRCIQCQNESNARRYRSVVA